MSHLGQSVRSVLTWRRPAGRHTRREVAVAAGFGLLVIIFLGGPGVSLAAAQPAVMGLDVSSHDPSIEWSSVVSDGGQFAYVKATEGTGFVNPDFAAQYDGSYQAGLIRGAYHFALPNVSGGAAQASYFVGNGGGWSADGRTLPGALDIEYDPYGAECYGLSQSAMVSWITSFADTYQALTTRWPVIYTTDAWWAKCTGDYSGFASEDPLWLPPGSTLPADWSFLTFSQYASHGTFPGDQDTFNGASVRLRVLATGR